MTTTFVLTIGDSIVAGGPILNGSPNWTELIQTRRKGTGFSADNIGVGGYTVLQAQALYEASYRNRGHTHAAVLVGTNPLASGSSASTVNGQLDTLVSTLRADGLGVVIFTIPPRGGSADWDGTKETARLVVNTHIRAMADVIVVDLEPSGVLGGTGSPLALKSGTDSGDALHPNGTGHVAMADAFDAATVGTELAVPE